MKLRIVEIEADARELRESQTLAQNFSSMMARAFQSREPFGTEENDEEEDDEEEG